MRLNHFMQALAIVGGVMFLSPSHASHHEHEGIVITVNVNEANAEELDKLLVGIGVEKAQAIIEYRNTHGKFVSMEDLSKVKGIGPSTINKNKDRIEL